MRYLVRSSCADTEDKGSRFLTQLTPTRSPDEVKAAVQLAWQQHPKASHVVYAWRTGCESSGKITEGFSDDGEPAGTAGMPVLRVLQYGELVNACILIVRYFGGTKLGMGGLQRAYAGAASAVLKAAPQDVFREWMLRNLMTLSGPFPTESLVRRLLSDQEIQPIDTAYDKDGYVLTFRATSAQIEQLSLALPFNCQLAD